MFFPVTPFLSGKLDALSGRRSARCPYEAGSQAAADYAKGVRRGRAVRRAEKALASPGKRGI